MKKISEEKIDEIVIAQADDDNAWEAPIHVNRKETLSISVKSEIASRAAFFARLHRKANIEDWLIHIINERLDMEEAAFAEMKRDLTAKTTVK